MEEDDIVFRLMLATSSSCTCLTKTPDPIYHKLDCRYRVIMDAMEEIKNLRKIK
jgi:hypothetical protein